MRTASDTPCAERFALARLNWRRHYETDGAQRPPSELSEVCWWAEVDDSSVRPTPEKTLTNLVCEQVHVHGRRYCTTRKSVRMKSVLIAGNPVLRCHPVIGQWTLTLRSITALRSFERGRWLAPALRTPCVQPGSYRASSRSRTRCPRPRRRQRAESADPACPCPAG